MTDEEILKDVVAEATERDIEPFSETLIRSVWDTPEGEAVVDKLVEQSATELGWVPPAPEASPTTVGDDSLTDHKGGSIYPASGQR